MLHLDLGTALLIWALVGLFAHEYGHHFMAEACGYKTIAYYATPIFSVLPETPKRQMHSILMLAGGWIFGVVSIFLFLPLVATEYIVVFLTASLLFETILFATNDAIGIMASLQFGVKETWLHYQKNVVKEHNKMAPFGLSKMIILDKKKYETLIKESIKFEHSIAFFDKMDVKEWMVLFSFLALSLAVMIAAVNWPFFWALRWSGVEVEGNFSIIILALMGIAFMSTITERLMLHLL